MKSFSTTLAIILIFAACSERERYAERYLDSVSLNIYMERSVEVSGLLKREYSPTDAMDSQGIFSISQLSFACSYEDSLEIANNMQNMPIPTQITTELTGSRPLLSYRQQGIYWEPRYRWTLEGESCDFSATAAIRNSTGREWFAENIVMMDASGEPACRISDTLIVAVGELELGWWNATGTVLPLTMCYGWPTPAQWNQVVPCLVPDAGTILEDRPNDGSWPISKGDTLWIPSQLSLETSEIIQQNSNGYSGILQIYNPTHDYIEVRITHPDLLPRGAHFVEREGFPSFVGMFPGDIVLLEYDIVYQL